MNTKLMLGVSKISKAGIGVFALEPIEANQKIILKNIACVFKQKKISDIPDEYLKYCPLTESGAFLCPENFHHMNIFWYLNHSNTPNLQWTKNGTFTNRKIKKGEELTVFYTDLETHPKNKIWNKSYLEELRTVNKKV